MKLVDPILLLKNFKWLSYKSYLENTVLQIFLKF